MNLRDVINNLNEETKPTDAKTFSDALVQAVDAKNFQKFKQIIEYAFKTKKYEWFALYFQEMNASDKLTKILFDKSSPF